MYQVTQDLKEQFETVGYIDFEGERLYHDKTDIEPGDTYVAGRNVKPYLLTARLIAVKPFNEKKNGIYLFGRSFLSI